MTVADTPRLGLVGTGFMGQTHAAAWRAIGNPPTAILADPNAEADPAVVGDAEVFTDLDAYLNQVELVDICTPTDTHPHFALAAANAGRPTLCEKPLALEATKALEIVRAFERAGVLLQVAHVVRFFPAYRTARDAVCSGEIGIPAVTRLARLSSAPGWSVGGWMGDDARSGGLFFDLAIHDLDWARWVNGEVASVQARLSAEHARHGVVILTHTNGALSHIESSWAEPTGTFRTRFEIAGSSGLITFDSETTTPMVARLHQDETSDQTPLTNPGVNPFELEVQHFLDVVYGRSEPLLTPLDALAAVQLAAAACKSAAQQIPVAIEPLGGDV
ncbi:MAG: Gfo/Idh/MocA family oxidoreductase [Propionibacteriaceae bacterium]|nr:Gfo/Idh/MocA family oxidoreductase [Propionibacteriaceae bacterium]